MQIFAAIERQIEIGIGPIPSLDTVVRGLAAVQKKMQHREQPVLPDKGIGRQVIVHVEQGVGSLQAAVLTMDVIGQRVDTAREEFGMLAQIPGPFEQRIRIEPLPPIAQVMGQGGLAYGNNGLVAVEVKGRAKERCRVTALLPANAEVVEQRLFVTDMRIGLPVPGGVENAVGIATLQPANFQVMAKRVRVPRI